MSEISNGVWFDSKANKVVESEPEEGVQLIAPGKEVTPLDQLTVQQYRDIESGVPSAVGTVGTHGTIDGATPAEETAEPKRSAKK